MSKIREHLEGFHAFDPEIVDKVEDAALEQNGLPYDSFAKLRRLPDVTVVPVTETAAVTVADFVPEGDYDEDETIAYHLWHGADISPNALMRAGTLHALYPDRRLVVFGNTDKVARRDLRRVFSGDIEPKVEPRMRYLHGRGIGGGSQIGHSSGADDAAVACTVAEKFDISVDKSVLSESASVVKRSLPVLGAKFLSTAKQIDRYVADADCRPLRDAREHENDLVYGLSLARPSNIAGARALSRGFFEQRVDRALITQESMDVTIAWVDESELVVDALMTGVAQRLAENHPGRVSTIRGVGHKHNFVDNIYLHTALMAEGLR